MMAAPGWLEDKPGTRELQAPSTLMRARQWRGGGQGHWFDPAPRAEKFFLTPFSFCLRAVERPLH